MTKKQNHYSERELVMYQKGGNSKAIKYSIRNHEDQKEMTFPKAEKNL